MITSLAVNCGSGYELEIGIFFVCRPGAFAEHFIKQMVHERRHGLVRKSGKFYRENVGGNTLAATFWARKFEREHLHLGGKILARK